MTMSIYQKQVVKLSEIKPEIALITMNDTENKNVFTMQFMDELVRAFQAVEKNDTYKAVILTGFGNYFMCGATQKMLLSMHDRETRFAGNENKIDIYSLAMQCKIPVIAAMQGHAIGGGFTFAMYSDVIIMARESVYAANFMNYGFTPGFGSTYILPKKLGIALAEEIMMTAGNYKGAELEKRGVPFKVYPRDEVMPHAVEIAEELAEKTRASLMLLKRNLVKKMEEEVKEAVKKELEMHAETITSDEAAKMIQERYL